MGDLRKALRRYERLWMCMVSNCELSAHLLSPHQFQQQGHDLQVFGSVLQELANDCLRSALGTWNGDMMRHGPGLWTLRKVRQNTRWGSTGLEADSKSLQMSSDCAAISAIYRYSTAQIIRIRPHSSALLCMLVTGFPQSIQRKGNHFRKSKIEDWIAPKCTPVIAHLGTPAHSSTLKFISLRHHVAKDGLIVHTYICTV